MEQNLARQIIDCGIQATVQFMKENMKVLAYENFAYSLYQVLKGSISLLKLYLYDGNGGMLEDVICSDSGFSHGYDILMIPQLPEGLMTENRTLNVEVMGICVLFIPLICQDEWIGFLEIRCNEKLSQETIDALQQLATVFSMAGYNVNMLNQHQRYRLFESSIEAISKELQSCETVEKMVTSFAALSVSHLKYDRVTVCLFDYPLYRDGISFMAMGNGDAFFLNNIPDIPDLSDGKPLQLPINIGYWIPLTDRNAQIGVVLFDNLLTLREIKEQQCHHLVALCRYLESGIQNIRLMVDVQRDAHFDRLTGLYNRTYFETELNRLDVLRQLPLTLIIGDVNGLKITNDVFGHLQGDELLKSIAAILKQSCRKDEIIARWGGDEFIILLLKTEAKYAEEVMDRIWKSCHEASYGLQVGLSISMGHATKRNSDENIKEIMKAAEDRMYRNKLMEKSSFRNTFITSLKQTLHERCLETEEHIDRILALAMEIGTKMRLSIIDQDELKLLAMLHDIGKVAINDSILNKPGKLDANEWEEMKKHTEIGYRIAQSSNELSQIAECVLSHHERWDGNGYPFKLKGEEIPLLSRIIAVIDAYDVMTHARPYKQPISHKEAVQELLHCSGTQFDPAIVTIFESLFVDNPPGNS
jgi:diguanylate cyclase (GGDEF)-like protein